MRPIVRFGIGIIVASVVIAVMVSVYFLLTYGSLNITMLVLPAGGVILGVALIVSGLGSYLYIEDEIESFEHLIGDDIQNLMSGYITYPHIKLAGTLIAIIAEVYLIFMYRKWTATWMGGVPVVVIAVACIGAILYGGVTMNWFQNRQRRTYWWVFALFFAGWVLSAWVGTYFAEPIEFGYVSRIENQANVSTPRYPNSYVFNWADTRIGRSSNTYSSSSGSGVGWDFSLPDCDGDACGAVILFIVILIIVIICIAASAYIPHFWVIATCMLLAAMALVTLREWLFVDSSAKSDKSEKAEKDWTKDSLLS